MSAAQPEGGPSPAVPGSVVVGVDGTEGSLPALRWAVAEAAAHAAPLWVVHVLDPRGRRAPYARVDTLSLAPADAHHVAEVERLIDRAVLEAGSRGGPQQVQRVFEIGSPADVLIRIAAGSRMLVVGHAPRDHRRSGAAGREGPSLGAVARACVARSACPVVVMPSPAQQHPGAPATRTGSTSAATGAPVEGGRALYPRFRERPVHR
jgi:nucleotide-binding universal stress UspA family protein